MKTNSFIDSMAAAIILMFVAACKNEPLLRINYELGIFPDSVIAISGLNSPYDDYNTTLEASGIYSGMPVVFSSNRHSSGGEFNLTHGYLSYSFGQTTGSFQLEGGMRADPLLDNLTAVFNTPLNDLGPYRFFFGGNGLEYMVAASGTELDGLDLFFTSYIPVYTSVPHFKTPIPATVFNSGFNDVYLSFNRAVDTAYFCSDNSGDYDIYMMSRPSGLTPDEWFTSPPSAAVAIDSLRTSYNEKCPFVAGRYLFFASDRPGGSGGYDLYVSFFRNGRWSAPLNLGPAINTTANEYRPVLGVDFNYENPFLIFSSDRPGGKGGYDLFFTGLDLVIP